jgi:hypothetical protein
MQFRVPAVLLGAVSLAACAHSAFVMRPVEAPAIVHVRAFISFEAAYSSVNGGHFDSPTCLLDPAKCIPDYLASEPRFLTEQFVAPPAGYRAVFHPGPPVPEIAASPTISKSSLESYAVTLEPAEPGGRWFCGDNRPTICYAEAPMRMVQPGRCPPSCRSIVP